MHKHTFTHADTSLLINHIMNWCTNTNKDAALAYITTFVKVKHYELLIACNCKATSCYISKLGRRDLPYVYTPDGRHAVLELECRHII